MAGHAPLVDEQEQRIAVAVKAQLPQDLDLSRALAFAPQLLPRPRPVAGAALARLVRTASRFIQASIRISPVSYCCAIAGTRPSEPKRISESLSSISSLTSFRSVAPAR